MSRRFATELTFGFIYLVGISITSARYFENFMNWQHRRTMLPPWKGIVVCLMSFPVSFAWPLTLPIMEYNERRSKQ